MRLMSHKLFKGHLYVRTMDRTVLALKRVVTELRGSGLRFQGKKLTQEAIVNASWLWMEELGPEVVKAGLAKHLQALDASVPVDDQDTSEVVQEGIAKHLMAMEEGKRREGAEGSAPVAGLEPAQVVSRRPLKVPGINAPARRSKKDAKDEGEVPDPPRKPAAKR